MSRLIHCSLFFLLLGFNAGNAHSQQTSAQKATIATIRTNQGKMRALLFEQTPLHKANFIKLSKSKFYNGLLFHRVISGFMIQGGDPKSRTAKAEESLGGSDNGYKVPAEIVPELFHQKGALAAARDGNPKKESSGCQFYIVQGKTLSDNELNQLVARSVRKPSQEQREVYKKSGGSPHLDGAYTVFGQVIDGLSVIDKIAQQPTDQRDRPKKDIRMKISIRTMSKKKIARKYGYSFS